MDTELETGSSIVVRSIAGKNSTGSMLALNTETLSRFRCLSGWDPTLKSFRVGCNGPSRKQRGYSEILSSRHRGPCLHVPRQRNCSLPAQPETCDSTPCAQNVKGLKPCQTCCTSIPLAFGLNWVTLFNVLRPGLIQDLGHVFG